MPKFKIDKFNGGITDFIYKFEDNFCEEADNLVINSNLGLETRAGLEILNPDYPQVTSEDRIGTLFEHQDNVMIRSLDALYTLDAVAGFSEIQGQGSRSIFYDTTATEDIDYTIINNQILLTSTAYKFRPLNVYKSTDYEASTLGLTQLASAPTVAPTAGSSTVSYIYAFVYFREYTSLGQTFQEFGEPEYVSVTSSSAEEITSTNTSAITNIPEVVNAVNSFYKTGTGTEDLKVRIYRTINNGNVFFYLNDAAGVGPGLVDNGTTTATDNVPDADLSLNEVLYTSGGVVDNNEPPLAKYVTSVKEVAWFANLSDAPNRIRQSKPLQPSACPESYYIDLDDDITGIGATRDYPIVFTDNKVYRLEGTIDELGRGDIQSRVITDRVGCINFRTIVQTRAGVYFAGTNGFYFTDGYSLTPISEQLEKRYPDLLLSDLAKNRMVGAYSTADRKMLFSVQQGADNDKIFVYDEDHNAWTTFSGQTTFNPTALGNYNNRIIKGDKYGYLYAFDDSVLTDIQIDTDKAVSDWGTEAIVYTFKHIASSLGDLRTKKWITKVNAQIDNTTGQHIDVGAFDERSYTRRELKPILVSGALPWGAAGIAWGSSGITWGGNEMISRTRRFPAGKLRTRFKQLSLTNYIDDLFTSTDYADATPNVSTKYVDIDSGIWPSDINQNTIVFDGITQEFPILDRLTDTRILVDDPSNLLPSVSTSWTIKGYRKSEKINLQNLTYTYVPLSDKGSYYGSGTE